MRCLTQLASSISDLISKTPFIHLIYNSLHNVYQAASIWQACCLIREIEVNTINIVHTFIQPQVQNGRQEVDKIVPSSPHSSIYWEAAQLPFAAPSFMDWIFLPLLSTFSKAFPSLLFTPFNLDSTAMVHRHFNYSWICLASNILFFPQSFF